jgi:hypothetical protein
MKWVPIFGMFTKDANSIPRFSDTNLLMILYHGFILGGLVCFIGYLFLI